jgi:hypothetical protein
MSWPSGSWWFVPSCLDAESYQVMSTRVDFHRDVAGVDITLADRDGLSLGPLM